MGWLTCTLSGRLFMSGLICGQSGGLVDLCSTWWVGCLEGGLVDELACGLVSELN